MQLDTINTLYLELSQVATATTAKELALQRQLAEVDAMIWPSGKPTSYEPNRIVALRAMFRLRQGEGKREDDQCAALREALKPFAEAHDKWMGGNAQGYFATAVSPADFKAAASALANSVIERNSELRVVRREIGCQCFYLLWCNLLIESFSC